MTKSPLDRIREETEEKQRAILWPDMLRSGRSVDEFLWKGDRRATPVQRIGLVVFATMFLFCASIFAVLLFKEDTWGGRVVEIIIGLLTGIPGVRLLINAFRHGPKSSKPK
jgi:hypothetical protein